MAASLMLSTSPRLSPGLLKKQAGKQTNTISGPLCGAGWPPIQKFSRLSFPNDGVADVCQDVQLAAHCLHRPLKSVTLEARISV